MGEVIAIRRSVARDDSARESAAAPLGLLALPWQSGSAHRPTMPPRLGQHNAEFFDRFR
jgi:hypothetical protein